MLTSIIANTFLGIMVVGAVVTLFFVYINGRDSREENRTMFEQYRRARRFARACQQHNGHGSHAHHGHTDKNHAPAADTSDVIDDMRVFLSHHAHSAK
ncbi:MAG: hypothetical protein IT292_11020 [Deltaproteobacteria bacterium]|nr:hypothetical protein [Deltaproteobacteria bacterium]